MIPEMSGTTLEVIVIKVCAVVHRGGGISAVAYWLGIQGE